MNMIERLEQERSKLNQRLAQIEGLLVQHREIQKQAAQLLGEPVDDVMDFSRSTAQSGIRGRESASGLEDKSAMAGKPEAAGGTADERRSVSADVRAFEILVADILQSATRPMDRGELLAEVTRRGKDVPGKEPLNTLGARMSRMPGVVNVREGGLRGYWLESRIEELSRVFG